MIKKLLLATFLALGLNAAPLAVDSTITEIKIKDQFEKEHVVDQKVKTILFAITPSIANDAFILFIEDKLKDFDIKFTKIAQGVPTGVSLENVDILSLSKAIQSKVEI
jgi:recombinational DNA repair protein RecR